MSPKNTNTTSSPNGVYAIGRGPPMYASAATMEPTPIASTGHPRAITSGSPSATAAPIATPIARCTCRVVRRPSAVARGSPVRVRLRSPPRSV